MVQKTYTEPAGEIHHCLIIGTTKTGKTTLAHYKAAQALSKKRHVIVYDPVMTETKAGTWPEHAALFDDRIKFMQYVNRVKDSDVYIDECADIFSHDQPENGWILTQGRHHGLQVNLMCQRPNMIAPSVRHQCTRIFVFRLSRTDLKMLGNDYAFDGIEKENLDRGDYLLLESGASDYERHNVFTKPVFERTHHA